MFGWFSVRVRVRCSVWSRVVVRSLVSGRIDHGAIVVRACITEPIAVGKTGSIGAWFLVCNLSKYSKMKF